METIKAISQTVLKKAVAQASQLPESQKTSVAQGKTYEVIKYSLAEQGHYQVELNHNAGTWYIFSDHWELSWENQAEIIESNNSDLLTAENLKAIMPDASDDDIHRYVAPLNQVIHDFDLATTARVCAFIAQIAHESGSFYYKEELASGADYEGREDLGNTQPGDGRRYKGRGLIQLTGRANYRECAQALDLPLEENPEMAVQDPYTNAAVAAWYWQSRDINEYADQGDFEKVTRLINGGLNGYSDRLQFWEKAKKVFGID
ncbi:glycoside hydrolase family 19 protein [Okeania hirsuta]|uniref:Glycoside hydrolase family 19 protein n=2 Tax=Okeania TaxID=1458928 RepID=A0A3N6RC01_9CYAN|nr:glycoside hydrolase family 19 protein [Okeania hirsuta]RQH17693.1 glycoside hydrolase family 19 protein [Okeania hirsuta]RQH34820.1 glycoside hydrolase family 19 protein [Okeania hirsuta]